MADLFDVQDNFGIHTYDREKRVYIGYCPQTGERVESSGVPAKVSSAGYELIQRGYQETRVSFTPKTQP